MSALPDDFALPRLDAFNAPWFASGTLAVQQCAACAALQHPPEEICHACGSMTFGHRVLAPRGTIYSYTVVHHPTSNVLAAAVPYVVVLVGLDEEPAVRVVGNLVDAPPSDARIGLAVEAVWDERRTDDGTVILLPQWRPA